MKRALVKGLCIMLLLSGTEVFATSKTETTDLASTAIVLENYSKEQLKKTIVSGEFSEEVRKAAELKYNNIIEKELKNEIENTNARVGYQVKNYSAKVVSSFRDRKGKFYHTVPQGNTVSNTFAISVSAGTNYDGYTIASGASVSRTITTSGPAYNTKLPGSSMNATHVMGIGVLRASITHVTYDLYDGSTGALIEHVDQYVMSDADAQTYNLLIADTAQGFYVGHCSLNKCKMFSSKALYKSVLESYAVTSAYSW